jgi:hypothetical protein
MNEIEMVDMLYQAMSEAISKQDMETVGRIEVQIKQLYDETEDDGVKERIAELFPDMEYMAEPSEEAEEELEEVMEMKGGGRFYRYGTASDIIQNMNKVENMAPRPQSGFYNPFRRSR